MLDAPVPYISIRHANHLLTNVPLDYPSSVIKGPAGSAMTTISHNRRHIWNEGPHPSYDGAKVVTHSIRTHKMLQPRSEVGEIGQIIRMETIGWCHTHTVHTSGICANLISLISRGIINTISNIRWVSAELRVATLGGLSRQMCWVLAAFIRTLGEQRGLTKGFKSAPTQMWQQQMDAFRQQAVKTCCT